MSGSQDHPVPIECPNCGRVNDTHAEPGLAAPTSGDIGICWKCREPYIFELIGRSLTDEERARLDADPEIASTLTAMRESYTPEEATELRREMGT